MSLKDSVLLKRQFRSQLNELTDELVMHNSRQYAFAESSYEHYSLN